jgi:hypothetical protein
MMTSQQDHDRQMKLLQISGFPPGPDAYQAATYEEATANPYPTLPDPLVMNDGSRVTTPAQWTKRRVELRELFDREVYGRVPKNTPTVKWEIVSSEKGLPMSAGFGGAAPQPVSDIPVITKQLVGHVDNSSYPAITVNIGMTLVTPASATGPVPIVMQFGGGGPNPMPANDTPNPCAPPPGTPPRGTGAGRAGVPPAGAGRGPVGPTGPNWQAQLLPKGWGYAMLNTSSIQADSGCGLTVGIIGLMNKGQPRKMDDWGSLRALAWGADRAMDYFETDKAVDAKHVGVEGHSRWGKATLVTMAYDERFAIGYVSSSGEGGAKLHRRKFGELIENLNGTSEYHWMAGNFMKYGTAESDFGSRNAGDLPVDAHELIALCAPRPTFISYGIPEKGDARWLDHQGSFMAAVAAGPVFRLLGAKDLGTSDDYKKEKMPAVGVGLLDGQLAWRQHDGGHTDGPNWKYFIPWADRMLKRTGRAG